MATAAVIGQDARTSCIARLLHDSGATVYSMSDHKIPDLVEVSKVFRQGKTNDPDQVVEFARDLSPDFVIVGPEEPLAAGVVDRLEGDLQIPCIGPTGSLARIEASKSFARELLERNRIEGRVEYRTFPSMDGLKDYLHHLGEFVVKADGLMGGKGVKVFGEHLLSIEDALAFAREVLSRRQNVVVEEKIEGEEFSLQSFVSGDSVVHTIPVQDHKRAWVGDTGPNTGGMGSYSCEDHLLPFLTREQLRAAGDINNAVARALQKEVGAVYRGVLYGGFMATPDGVRVLEFNARFGDPEAMNILPLLKGPSFLEICEAIATGTLGRLTVGFESKATVCKYLVPKGYPDETVNDGRVRMDSIPRFRDDLRIYKAKVEQDGRDLVLTGSRAIAFVGIADSVEQAGQIAEEAISAVEGPVTHRPDIGTPELIQKRVSHMEELRERRDSKRDTVAHAAI